MIRRNLTFDKLKWRADIGSVFCQVGTLAGAQPAGAHASSLINIANSFDFSDLELKMPDFPGLRAPLIPTMRISPPIENPFSINMKANYASEFHSRLVKLIDRFDASLDNEHEVGVRLVSFGQTITFHLRDLGYWNPSLISLTGELDGGEPVELIQHVSQISILLMKMRRTNPKEAKKPIGFRAPQPDAEGNL